MPRCADHGRHADGGEKCGAGTAPGRRAVTVMSGVVDTKLVETCGEMAMGQLWVTNYPKNG